MLRRNFSNSLKILNKKDSLESVYSKLLKNECFKPLIAEIPPTYAQLSPYELSELINETVARSPLKNEQLILIHNKMIEELSKHEYGVSTVHTKKLAQLGGELSKNAIIEIIRNNPGRVHDSWELMQKFPKDLWTEALVFAAVENTLSKKIYEENGEEILPLSSLAQCIVLLQHVDQKHNIKREIWDTLIGHVLKRKSTGELQPLLQYGFTSLEPFSKQISDLTPYQIYQLYENFPLNLLEKDEGLFFKILNTVGKLEKITLSEEELCASKELSSYIEEFGGVSNLNDLCPSKNPVQSYLHLKNYIHEYKLDRTSIKLARNILRIEGIYKGDVKNALELYHAYLLTYENRANELMFEIFLTFVYQGYKDSDQKMFEHSQLFLHGDGATSSAVDIICILMLGNSRFDVGKSLELYNNNIEAFTGDKQESIASSLLTESLIMSYLGNQDLDFARVIFEGAIREKILGDTTVIKRLKALFKCYGDAVEQGDVQVVMQNKILRTFETIRI